MGVSAVHLKLGFLSVGFHWKIHKIPLTALATSHQYLLSTAISWNVETVVQCQRKENAKCLIEDSSL